MRARRGETSGCRINRASSESKQEGKERKGKREIKSTSAKAAAFETRLGCGRALEGCLFIFRSRDKGTDAIGVLKSVYDEMTGSASRGKIIRG